MTLAVCVTESPYAEGFELDVTVVVVSLTVEILYVAIAAAHWFA